MSACLQIINIFLCVQVLWLTPGDLLACIYLSINRLAPEYQGVELGVGMHAHFHTGACEPHMHCTRKHTLSQSQHIGAKAYNPNRIRQYSHIHSLKRLFLVRRREHSDEGGGGRDRPHDAHHQVAVRRAGRSGPGGQGLAHRAAHHDAPAAPHCAGRV